MLLHWQRSYKGHQFHYIPLVLYHHLLYIQISHNNNNFLHFVTFSSIYTNVVISKAATFFYNGMVDHDDDVDELSLYLCAFPIQSTKTHFHQNFPLSSLFFLYLLPFLLHDMARKVHQEKEKVHANYPYITIQTLLCSSFAFPLLVSLCVTLMCCVLCCSLREIEYIM